MRDFPVSEAPTLDDALKKIHARYDKLNTDHFVNILSCASSKNFVRFFSYLPLMLHQYLLNGIVSNADHYRRDSDPDHGRIFFGPNQRFTGWPPRDIEKGIRMASSHLVVNENKAIHNAVKFYQQFVMVHPFYDTNGRIGRFIVEAFLNFHGIGIFWEKLCANMTWLKKLNDCHKRFNGPDYDRYLGFLVSHWAKFTFIEEIEIEL